MVKIKYVNLPVVISSKGVSIAEKIQDQVESAFRECLEEAYSDLSLLSSKKEVLNRVKSCIENRFGPVSNEEIEEVWKNYMDRHKKIIEILEELKEQSLSRKEHFKVRAYRKAISTIEGLKVPIISGSQAQRLPGIGKKIAAKIDEILSTGELEAIARKTPKEKERERILKEFRDIWGVGPVTAIELYNKGYRSVREIPSTILNAKQEIGLRYYDDLKKRIPREEITRFKKDIEKALKKVSPKLRYCICGSYRRGLKTSGDIDVLITYEGDNPPKNLFKKILETLRNEYILAEDLAVGKDVYNGITIPEGIARRIDIHYVPLDEWGSSVLYFTGSKQFNIDMRNMAIKQGLKLSDKGLFDANNNRLPVYTEKEIFEALGLPYIKPKDRTDLSRFQ